MRKVERETDTPGVAYEVELVKPDGSTVEVHLNGTHRVVGTDQDPDQPDEDAQGDDQD